MNLIVKYVLLTIICYQERYIFPYTETIDYNRIRYIRDYSHKNLGRIKR